ncbi:GPW/gp25 family protein [Hellea sp.]|nr:GPW/gp25 family protein [Hellea sp.]
MHLDHAFHFDNRGRTASAKDETDYIQDLIELTLLTSPGERVNHPEFGAGLGALIFEPAGGNLTEAAEFMTRSNLQRWLQNLIVIDELNVEAEDSTLTIYLSYIVIATGERSEQTVVRRT